MAVETNGAEANPQEAQSTACMGGAWYSVKGIENVNSGDVIGLIRMNPATCNVTATATGKIRWKESDGQLVNMGDVVAIITVAAPAPAPQIASSDAAPSSQA